MSLRLNGMLNDAAEWQREWPLEYIAVPTLVIHAEDDGLVPFSHGEYSAKLIPDARFIPLPSGGHILMGQHDKLRSEIAEFLRHHPST